MRSRRNARTSARRARTDSFNSAEPGITLGALPALIAPTVTTAMSFGSTSRETSVWKARMRCAHTITGSTVVCGIAPCPPLPSMVTMAVSDEL